MYPNLKWREVFQHLDHPKFIIPDVKALALLSTAFKRASKDPFPIDLLLKPWNNTSGQLSFLRYAVTTPDLVNFGLIPSQTTFPIKKVNDWEGLLSNAPNSSSLNLVGFSGSKTGTPSTATLANQNWLNLSLIETLLWLAERENYMVARSVFQYPAKNCPDLLLYALSQAKPTCTWNLLGHELIHQLSYELVVSSSSTSQLCLHKLWNSHPSLVIRALVDLYSRAQTHHFLEY